MESLEDFDDVSSDTSATLEPEESLRDEGDYMDDDRFAAWLAETSTHSSSQCALRPERQTKRVQLAPRNPPLTPPFRELDSCDVNGLRIYRQTSVELRNGAFLRVRVILQNSSSSQILLRGWRFQRTREVYGFLPNKTNEVCWVMQVDLDDPRESQEQAMETAKASEVVKRRGIRMTNRPFPELSFRDDPREKLETILKHRVLVCRWKYVSYFANASARSHNKWSERSLARLCAFECDTSPNSMVAEELLRHNWRGTTIRGGTCRNWLQGEKEFLRQESLSSRGLKIRQTLKSDTDEWPLGEPMERGCVGIPVTEDDWKKSSKPAPCGNRSHPINFTTITEIGADIRTSTPAGMFQSRYEGRLTSTFSPTRKRNCEAATNLCFAKRPKGHSEATLASNGSDSEMMPTRQQSLEHTPTKSAISNVESIIDLTNPYVRGDLYRPQLPSAVQTSNLRGEISSSETNRTGTKQRYTFADCFCGAGGVSRGAVMAGCRVSWAFDFNVATCESYGRNFLGTPVYNMWANDFVSLPIDLKVDVLHLSPPCPVFSLAHTHQGKNDEMNTATQFAIFSLVQKIRPRIVTLEQTGGLLQIEKHRQYFNSLIHMFTSLDYNIRWRLINFADYGLPQRRLRLVIIASCPGEALPPFPKPTHAKISTGTDLKPWTTINEAISNIPENWPDHDIEATNPRDRPPYSGERIAACITTADSVNYHPSGKRDYTHRELACLQSFPLCHKFGDTGIKRQIGNAVPPLFASILLEEIRKALLKADGLA